MAGLCIEEKRMRGIGKDVSFLRFDMLHVSTRIKGSTALARLSIQCHVIRQCLVPSQPGTIFGDKMVNSLFLEEHMFTLSKSQQNKEDECHQI